MKISVVTTMAASIAVFMCMVPFVASGQTIPEMLNGQWFSVKASVKGYGDYNLDQATTKGGGSVSGLYIYTTYDAGTRAFSMTACSPIPGTIAYSASTVPSIPVFFVKGDLDVKQVWDLVNVYFASGTWLHFLAPSGDQIDVIPTLYMTVKVDGNTFKSASFKSLGCNGWWFGGSDPYTIGSCKLSGKTVDFEKVPIGARMACIP